jgi:hypothetical protein
LYFLELWIKRGFTVIFRENKWQEEIISRKDTVALLQHYVFIKVV